MNFWQKIPYAKRNGYLLVGAVLFAILAWKLSLSATYSLYIQNAELERQLQQAKDAPAIISRLQQQDVQWEEMALAYTASSNDVQKMLFASVSEACASNKVVLRELLHAGSADEAGAQVETFRIQLEGSYRGLLKATHQLEKELKGGQVVSAQYQKIHDRKNKRFYLQATLYIQSIIEESYDKD